MVSKCHSENQSLLFTDCYRSIRTNSNYASHSCPVWSSFSRAAGTTALHHCELALVVGFEPSPKRAGAVSLRAVVSGGVQVSQSGEMEIPRKRRGFAPNAIPRHSMSVIYAVPLTPLAPPPQLIGKYASPMECLGFGCSVELCVGRFGAETDALQVF